MPRRKLDTANRLLWTAQGLTALLFLFAGTMKFVLPADKMQGPVALSIGFIHFIGVCEIAGAAGLLLPGLLRVQTLLTPLAAVGLIAIMVGATAITAATMGIGPAIFPGTVGLILSAIAWGRWRVAPLRERSARAVTLRAAGQAS
jgi:uncharacterized membrane protein YphA (DoxX/SURF4 family)